MFRSALCGLALVFCGAVSVCGQADPNSLEAYFTGKMVVAKIDMPGTEKGIDLSFNKPSVVDWKEQASRLTAFGVAIHKGDVARVTKIVVKSDHIEFHLDGGGFGSFGDDTNTTVVATPVEKSAYEKDLEKKVAAATDPKQKRELQSDLDRERARREREQAANQNAAMVASQMKAQQVAEKRLRGGSRFNLRWQGSVPSDDLNPETVMKLLADYVDFDATHGSSTASVAMAPTSAAAGGGDASQLKRGMKIDEVSNLLGQGQVISQSVSSDGLKTQVFEFKTVDSVVDVTCVEGVVVRYSMNSR